MTGEASRAEPPQPVGVEGGALPQCIEAAAMGTAGQIRQLLQQADDSTTEGDPSSSQNWAMEAT